MQGCELPSEWANSKRQATTQAVVEENNTKRNKVGMETANKQLSPFPLQTTEVTVPQGQTLVDREGLRDQLLHTIEEHQKGSDDQGIQSLEVESLLARLPYKKLMADLFGSGLGNTLTVPKLQYITRAYEESYMREKVHASERLCAKDKMCECMFIDKANPFIAVEFLLPGEVPPATPHMCVVCCRATTQQLYYDIVYDKEEFHGCIQRYGNLHSQEGEYALEAMLVMPVHALPHVMPLPVVAHKRNCYKVHVHSGVRCLRQTRVYFQSAPSPVA